MAPSTFFILFYFFLPTIPYKAEKLTSFKDVLTAGWETGVDFYIHNYS